MKLIGGAILLALIVGALIVIMIEIIWIGIMAAVSIVLAALIWMMIARMKAGGGTDD